MTAVCRFDHPLQRDGTSQRGRLLPALEPSSVAVDERGLPELLGYVQEYAKLLVYYGPDNTPRGDWVPFVATDATAVVASMVRTDVAAVRASFEAVGREATDAVGYGQLLGLYLIWLSRVDEWYRAAPDSLPLKGSLQRLISSVFGETLRKVLPEALRARATSPGISLAPIDRLSDVWGFSAGVGASPPGAVTALTNDELATAVATLATAIRKLLDGLSLLVNESGEFLRQTLESYPEHQPQVGLLLGFLDLLGVAQRHMNRLTAAHLGFYFGQVLALRGRPAHPDHVHVVFELARHAEQHLLPAGTELKAGKDEWGVERVYVLDRELAVNRATLDLERGLKSVFVDLDAQGVIRNIHAAPKAASSDGLGGEIEDEDEKWLAFGDTSRPFAQIGFALSSSMLRLAEGQRTIRLGWALRESSPILAKAGNAEFIATMLEELSRTVLVSASGAEQWLPLEVRAVRFSDGTKTYTSGTPSTKPAGREPPFIEYELVAGPEVLPITNYDPKKLAAGFDTREPVLQFAFDNEGLPKNVRELLGSGTVQDFVPLAEGYAHGSVVRHGGRLYQAKVPVDEAGVVPAKYPNVWRLVEPAYPYKYFVAMDVKALTIAVDVEGLRGLVLESDLGALNAGKPFMPFGPLPKQGSTLFIGSPEAFAKPVTNLQLFIQWADLPSVNFADHYAAYKAGNSPIVADNDHFKWSFEILRDGRWTPIDVEDAEYLFEDAPAPKKKVARAPGRRPSEKRDFTLEIPALPRPSVPAGFSRLDAGLRQGFLRARLSQSFLHSLYPQLLLTPGAGANVPYTPLISELSLGYHAELTLDYASLGERDFAGRLDRLFQIGPFGRREVFPIVGASAGSGVPVGSKLVPEFAMPVASPDGSMTTRTANGTFYVGLDKLDLPQNLSLLVRVAEGSEDPLAQAPVLGWSYWADGVWRSFEPSEVVSDTTNGLLTSGIIQLALPNTMTTGNQLLPADLYWIKASVVGDTRAIPQLIALHTQAAHATFRDAGNDPAHLARPLPSGSISKLERRDAAIKAVSQPYASFGGRMLEPEISFNTRVSEQLRHKGRASSIFDYERLVLEQFPEVYKVKCINHTGAGSEFAPGHVTLVAVPDLRNVNAVDPLRPRLSLNKLRTIEAWLRERASEFVCLRLSNPDYQEVRVRFRVRFVAGKDQGLYTGILQQDIIRFLSPWLYDDGADLAFGARVHRSSILDYVERRDYVDFVADFSLDHHVGEIVHSDVEEAVATTASAVLVSASSHDIDATLLAPEGALLRRRCPGLCDDTAEAPVTPAEDQPPLPAGYRRYLGNVRSRELHDLLNLHERCLIHLIAEDRRYYFKGISQALAMGYDYCAFCFPDGLSQR
jgi:hypothetical protein